MSGSFLPKFFTLFMQRWMPITKELSWVIVGQSLSFTGGILGVKLLTNALPSSEYGELALGISVAGVMNAFGYGPLGQVVLRFYSVCREEGTLSVFFEALKKAHLKTAILILAAGALFTCFASVLWGRAWGTLVAVAILFGVVSGAQGVMLSLASAMRKRKDAAVAQSADVWLRMICAGVFVLVISSTGWWAIVGYLAGSLLVLSWQLSSSRYEISEGQTDHELVRALEKKFLAYGSPFLIYAGIAAVGQYADRWLLQGFWGAREVGIYAALFQVAAAPITFVMAIINQVIIPIVFSRAGNLSRPEGIELGRSLIQRTELLLIGFFAILTTMMYLGGRHIVRILTNEEYAESSNVAWVIMLGLAIFNLGQLSSVFGYSLNRTDIYIWPKTLQGAWLLIFGGVLGARDASKGMALAVLLSSCLYFLHIKLLHARLFSKSPSVMPRASL
jgi:O-antigen/teichoic acid export membrane protein